MWRYHLEGFIVASFYNLKHITNSYYKDNNGNDNSDNEFRVTFT